MAHWIGPDWIRAQFVWRCCIVADEWDEFEDFDGDKEYEDSLSGRFEETVDKVVEMRLSLSNGICDQIKNIANSVRGVNEEDEDYEPGPVAKVVDTVNSVDQAIVEGTADVIKGIGRTILGIF